MPYPARFPYELLNASPDDPLPVLQRKWGQATVKNRGQAQEIKNAFDELKDTRVRLGYDALLVTGVAAPADLGPVTQSLANPALLPALPSAPRITLALSDLAGDPAEHFRPVRGQPLEVSPSPGLDCLAPGIPAVPFDR